MKDRNSLLIILLISWTTQAQTFNKPLQEKMNQTIVQQGDSFLLKDFYESGKMHMSAMCFKEDTLVRHGKVTYYYNDKANRKWEQGNYAYGKRTGQWIRWHPFKQDSSIFTVDSLGKTHYTRHMEGETAPRETGVFTIVDHMPQYPGGDDAMQKFIRENVNYPEEAKKKRKEATVYAAFIVDTDGSLLSAHSLRPAGYGFDEEVMRIISIMPKWIPGSQNGQAVKVQYYLPIKFKR